MAFGIDLGTTYSAVATMKDGRPELIPNALGDLLTPSVVAVGDNGQLLVGKAARERAVSHPDQAVAVFKRHMGSSWSVKLGGRDRTATELSAILLAQLRREAEESLGGPISDVVITVPAYFNDAQRSATIEAGQAAGLNVLRVINEPTAAAIAYGLDDLQKERMLAIIDLGGGTFDVSIVEQYEGVVEVKSSAGEIFLGGEDFTAALVSQLLQKKHYVLELAEAKFPQMVSRLRHIAERIKRELSTAESATFRWPNEAGKVADDGEEMTVERSQFDEWTAPILTRITRPLRRAISDAGVQPDEITDVILVGGATRMPALVKLVSQLFHQDAKNHLPPDTVVAMGAAIQAGLIEKDQGLGELMVTDVAPFTLGIETSRKIGTQYREGYFMPIISRNTPLPTSRSTRVSTLEPNQTQVKIAIYQGESRRVEDNLQLGEFTVDGVPPGPSGQEVDIRFSYDLNGILEAEATVVKTQKKKQLVISKLAKRSLTNRQIQQAVAEMAVLKINWRDKPENQLLLNRAERMIRELSQFDREQLDSLLTAFEQVLEDQDRSAVEEIRMALTIFLESRDRTLDWDGDIPQ